MKRPPRPAYGPFRAVAASFLDRSGRFTAMGSIGGAKALISASMDRNPGHSKLYFPQFASPDTNNGYADNMDGNHVLQAAGEGLSYFVNDGRGHAEGLEFEVSAAKSSGLAATAGYALSTGNNDLAATPLANSQRSTFKLNGIMPVSRQGFATLDLVYSNPITDYLGTRVPAYDPC